MSDTCTIAAALARDAQNQAIRRRRKREQAARRRAGTLADPPVPKPGRLSPQQQQGRAAEHLVHRYLESAGLEILLHNLRCRAGEIDLVCRDKQQLVFAEVRQRSSSRYGGAAATVDLLKQGRLIRVAQYYLPRLSRRFFNHATPPCRFDVIAVDGTKITWIRHAFDLGDNC